VPELVDARPEALLQIHPSAAAGLGIGQGDLVEVSNARGIATCRAEVTADIRHDTVFLPFHFAGEQCANLLTEAITDPISGMPEFKRTGVRVRAHDLAAAGTR
jgi:assimilatory nitrate reductase catalytic subunit